MRFHILYLVFFGAHLFTAGGSQLQNDSGTLLVSPSTVLAIPQEKSVPPKSVADVGMSSAKPDNSVKSAVKRHSPVNDKDPKEEPNDDKAEGQLLELIVKIAEHPKTWKQIHRVLETLEANNAAYSSRVSSVKSALGHGQGIDAPPRNTDERLGDKRNDLPNVPERIEDVSSSAISAEKTFQRWKDILFAEEPLHPQLKVAEEREKVQTTATTQWPSLLFPGFERERLTSSSSAHRSVDATLEIEKSFDDRLKDIEKELKKLSKLTRWTPSKSKHAQLIGQGRSSTSKFSQPVSIDKTTGNVTSPKIPKTGHRFLYHKVSNVTEDKKSPEPNLWKRIASARSPANNTGRRRTFVAVSILSTQTESTPKTITDVHPTLPAEVTTISTTNGMPKSKLNRKKMHQQWKQKQRQQISQADVEHRERFIV